MASRPPDTQFTEKVDHKTYRVQLWDTEGLPFTIDNPEPVRVVCSEEVLERHRYRHRELTLHATDQEWLWVTTLPQQALPAPVIRQLGHSRWKNENNGWMDLTKHRAFKHGFLHACRHRPKQTNPSGERELVPNHSLAAVTLILLIAFALSSALVLRHSKLARRACSSACARQRPSPLLLFHSATSLPRPLFCSQTACPSVRIYPTRASLINSSQFQLRIHAGRQSCEVPGVGRVRMLGSSNLTYNRPSLCRERNMVGSESRFINLKGECEWRTE
jgi:hypothetical protein